MTGCVLAVDLGTGGPKVALVDAAGTTLAWRSRPVTTTFLPDGGAEQDPREMWDAVVAAALDALGALDPVPPVLAVAVTSQYMSTIPVAADGAWRRSRKSWQRRSDAGSGTRSVADATPSSTCSASVAWLRSTQASTATAATSR